MNRICPLTSTGPHTTHGKVQDYEWHRRGQHTPHSVQSDMIQTSAVYIVLKKITKMETLWGGGGGGGGVAKVSERGSASEQLTLTEQFNNAKPTPSTYAHSATDAI